MTQILLTAPTTKLPSEILLRPEQKEIVGSTYHLIRNGARRVLVTAVMGLGKTLVAAWMMRDAVSRERRCVFLVTLNVLIHQTVDTLSSLGVNCTILQGDRPVDRDAPVIVASLQTISIRLRRGNTLDNLLGPIGVVMVDEAHIAAFHNAYQSIEDRYLPTGTIFLGLTATPWRLSTKEYLVQV
jgi:superfamily II DNA or RNA helicase